MDEPDANCVIHNQQDFGYSAETGEIGDVVWRGDKKKAYYADPIEPVGLRNTLYAEGDISLDAASSDADAFIGCRELRSLRRRAARLAEAPRLAFLGLLPAAGESLGEGTLTVGITDPRRVVRDAKVSIKVKEAAAAEGALLDRFGVRNLELGGHSRTFHLDNLRYTAAPGDPGPVGRCPPGT